MREHERLEAQLQAHLLAVIGGEFAEAAARLADWRTALSAHIAVEERELLPHLPLEARWAARVYLQEHERLAAARASQSAGVAETVED